MDLPIQERTLAANLEEDVEDEEAREEMVPNFVGTDPIAYNCIWEEGDYDVCLNMLSLLETVLCFNKWLKMDSYWKSDNGNEANGEMNKATESIRIMMDAIRHFAPRLSEKGKLLQNGWCIPKLHNLTHIPQQITHFSPAKYCDVETGERNHKFIIKNNALTAQKRGHGVFIWQLAQRIWESQTLDIIASMMDLQLETVTECLKDGRVPYAVEMKTPHLPDEEVDVSEEIVLGHTNSRFLIEVDSQRLFGDETTVDSLHEEMERVDPPIEEVCYSLQMSSDLREAFSERVLERVPGKGIQEHPLEELPEPIVGHDHPLFGLPNVSVIFHSKKPSMD